MEALNEKLNLYKVPIALSMVGLVLIIGGIFSSGLFNEPKTYPKESLSSSKQANSQIKVDVSGAVNRPAVYSLSSNSRVEDAIKAAGGFSASASAEFVTKMLNLSAKLVDGQKIYIPFIGERQGGGTAVLGTSAATGSVGTKIGINSASQSELESLPGVGPATASKITSLRPYSEILDLKTKKAVSNSVFEKIKDLVDLN